MRKSVLVCLIANTLVAEVQADSLTAARQESVLYFNATLINPATEQQLNDGWLLVQDGLWLLLFLRP